MVLWLLTTTSLLTDYPTYAVPRLEGTPVAGLPAQTGRIAVDQFGYRPTGQKVAVITDPQRGYNEGDSYTPGPELQLRRRSGEIVLRAAPKAWNNGATHEDSGDRGWWFDFSSVTAPGEYYVFDPSTQLRSPLFRIDDTVFSPILRAASRMFYYQRLGVRLEAKFAGESWSEPASLLQDAEARYVLAKEDPSTARDLSKGWMDAGDTNKYPPFNGDTIHPLLYAYRSNPSAFSDANNIPESGNGTPDLLDEVKFQLEWLMRMQWPDGSVPVKMGNIDYNGVTPLWNDKRPRYYGPKDSGAAIYTAANFAHAARVYRNFPQWRRFASDLQNRALRSWNWFQTNPRTFDKDTGEIKSGIANRTNEEQDRMEVFAAVHLYALTGEKKYNDVIVAKAGRTRQLSEGIWSPYESGAGEALAEYATFPNADPALAKRIKDHLAASARNAGWAPGPEADLYRAWMVPTSYHWGSNFVRAAYGNIALIAARYADLPAAERTRLRNRAADMLHSFHGVNPFSAVFLSNMGSYGAELSMMRIYHERFNINSKNAANPAPGYVVGGPNQSFSGRAADGAPSVEWIKTQPRAKAYADFNRVWPEASWELSEPAIYYQSMYVRLLGEFAK